MTVSFDLSLIALLKTGVQSTKSIPGLYVAEKPRHPTRGKKDDQLILFISMQRPTEMTLEQQSRVMARLAENYYKTPGSVTSGFRIIAKTLNQYLLEYNRRAGSNKQPVFATLNQLVLRNGCLYLAHSGPAHTYLISSSRLSDICDIQISGQGLGINQTTPIYYQQIDLNPDDILILSPQSLNNWNTDHLKDIYHQGFESVYDYFSPNKFQAVLIQAKKGSGRTNILQPMVRAPGARIDVGRPIEENVQITVSDEERKLSSGEDLDISDKVFEEGISLQELSFSPTTQDYKKFARKSAPIGKTKPSMSLKAAKIGLSSMQTAENVLTKATKAISNMVNRILPGDAASGLPSSVMFIVALAVPLLVVSIASVVYFRSGLVSQHEISFQLAQQSANQALTLDNPDLERIAWQNVISNLDQAESYRKTSETINLRLQAQHHLDELDKIVRLIYQPVIIDGLPPDTQITHLAASGNELFMLDSSSGSVLRAMTTSNGYHLDSSFQCSPESPGAEGISSLIDFIIVPKASGLNAVVQALDNSNNFVTCIVDEEVSVEQPTPPSTGMGLLKAFTLELGNLYFLDPEKNAVWIYWDSNLSEEPELFFTDQIPVLDDITDIGVSENDLYLLHADGHLTLCGYSNWEVAPTRCTDPAVYIDSRQGHEKQPYYPQTPFSQLQTTQPPDPSLFFFEPKMWSLHHFSLRQLTYHRQYRPAEDLVDANPSSIPTSFTINVENRTVFMVYANQLYFAKFP